VIAEFLRSYHVTRKLVQRWTNILEGMAG